MDLTLLLTQTYLDAHHQAILFEDSKAILETEIKIVEDALGGFSYLSGARRTPFTCLFQVTKGSRVLISSRARRLRSLPNALIAGCASRPSFFGVALDAWASDEHLGIK
jgi:hypothetical protein